MMAATSPSETVARVRQTFDSGRTRSHEWRRRQLLAISEMLERRIDDIVEAMTADITRSEEECRMELGVCTAADRPGASS